MGEQEKRYNEPKIIRDIINDMNLNPAPQINNKVSAESRRFAKKLMKILERYTAIIEIIDPLYKDASLLISQMDDYTIRQKNILMQSRGKLTQEDIIYKMDALRSELDDFESRHKEINKGLRKATNKFESENDKKEYTIKTNDFRNLFIDIYKDLENIISEYSLMYDK